MLPNAGILRCRLVDTAMNPNSKLILDWEESLHDDRYKGG